MTATQLTAEIERSPAGPSVGAFFDLDGTLIYGFSALVFGQDRLRRLEVSPQELARSIITGVAFGLGRIEYDALVSGLARGWRGKPEVELEELGERLFQKRISGLIYPEARALVAAHRARGHTVALASSALRYQVEPVARDLEIDHVLCTRLEVEDGLLTGAVAAGHLWGEGKRKAVEAFAGDQGVDLGASFAYADGHEDVALLEAVGNPRPTNPNKGLERIARRRDWPVHRFTGRGPTTPDHVIRDVAAAGGFLSAVVTGAGIGLLNRSRDDAVNTMISMGADLTLGLAGVHLDVSGAEHLWSHRPAVFIFNHQSNVDPLVIMALVRRDLTGVGKKELAANPVLRGLGALSDFVFIDRSDPAGAVAALGALVDKALARGKSLAIAPEGTRSPTPRLGPFKKGAFRLAMAGGVPVVPIVIRNSSDVWPKSARFLRPGTIDVAVHPPLPVDGWTPENLDERIAEIRRLYLDTLADWPAGDGR
jgi:putative phosphoserine phosphatase / 1-acylglycerol-3-phosphate O-acyltransferase